MASISGRRTSRWLLNLLTLAITAVVIFPIYWMFLTSVSDERAMYSANPPLLPLQPQLDAFVDLLQTSGISGWIVNTVFVASCTAAVVLVISIHGGYSLSRFRFRGATFFALLLLATQMLPEALIIVPIYIIFRFFGLLNSLFALIIVNAAFAVPIGIWIMKGYFDTVPRELEDAAMVDGCSRLQALYRVILPSTLPAIIAVAVIVFFEAWNEYLFASTLITTQERWVTSVGLASFVGMFITPIEQVMAGALLFTLPVLLFYLVLQRYIIGGLTSGAVRG
jgi:multiple sugar transport system permease protein